MPLTIPSTFLNRPVRIVLAGLSRQGEPILSGLAHLNHLLKGAGHPGGLEVAVFTPATVQSRSCKDLISRMDVTVHDHQFTKEDGTDWDILITSQLSEPHRAVIGEIARKLAKNPKSAPRFWLDTAQGIAGGSVTLGSIPCSASESAAMEEQHLDEPAPTSLVQQLSEANPFNDNLLASQACGLLWTLFRSGQIKFRGYHNAFLTGCTSPARM